jgi:hypothetical protein
MQQEDAKTRRRDFFGIEPSATLDDCAVSPRRRVIQKNQRLIFASSRLPVAFQVPRDELAGWKQPEA